MAEDNKPCDVHEAQIDFLAGRMDKVEEILDKVRNRLPIWATSVLAALLGIIGYLVSLLKGV